MSQSPFELEPDDHIDPPDLPGHVKMCASNEEAVDAAIHELHSAADAAVRTAGRFHLAVSGDMSLEPMWARLMIDPDFRLFPWPETHLWITGSANDVNSTVLRVQESLILPAGIPTEHVHATLGEGLDNPPLDAAVLSAAHAASPQPDELECLCAARTLRIIGLGGPFELSHTLAELAGTHQGDLRWYLTGACGR